MPSPPTPPRQSIADVARDNLIVQTVDEQRIIALATKGGNLSGPEQTEAIKLLLGRTADRIKKQRKAPS